MYDIITILVDNAVKKGYNRNEAKQRLELMLSDVNNIDNLALDLVYNGYSSTNKVYDYIEQLKAKDLIKGKV